MGTPETLVRQDCGAHQALLWCCARVEMPPTRREHLQRLIAANVDWHRLLLLGRRHGLLGLVYWHLKALPPTVVGRVVPADRLSQLRDHFHGNNLRCLTVGTELVQLVRLLAGHDIPALSLKGVAMATQLYGNPALRQPGDLDLLVRPSDASSAIDLLLQLGYRPHASARLTRSRRRALTRFVSQLAFVHPDTRIEVDLHWRLLSPFFDRSPDFTDLWPRRALVALRAGVVPVPTGEDLLAFLCLHGGSHGWGCLKWLCDVAELLRASPDLDWTRAAQSAHRREWMLWLGLALAHELLDAPLPPDVRARIDDEPELPQLVTETRDRLQGRPVGSPSRVVDHLADLVVRGGVRSSPLPGGPEVTREARRTVSVGFSPLQLDRHSSGPLVRARLWLRVATTPTLRQIQLVSLPTWLFPVYHLLRVARVLRTACVGARSMVGRQV